MSSAKQFTRKLRQAERHLSNVCPTLASWINRCGRCSLAPDWSREPMESLVRAVAHQQLHGRAAESILGRLIARFPDQVFPTSQQLSRMRVESYRKCGFSHTKTEAIRGIAQATAQDKIPNRLQADLLSDAELIDCLTELKGVGRWTVEMLLIFTMGRLDIMPIDDFGVRSGLMQLFALEKAPNKLTFAELTDAWKPYRSIGAWYLWRIADEKKSA